MSWASAPATSLRFWIVLKHRGGKGACAGTSDFSRLTTRFRYKPPWEPVLLRRFYTLSQIFSFHRWLRGQDNDVNWINYGYNLVRILWCGTILSLTHELRHGRIRAFILLLFYLFTTVAPSCSWICKCFLSSDSLDLTEQLITESDLCYTECVKKQKTLEWRNSRTRIEKHCIEEQLHTSYCICPHFIFNIQSVITDIRAVIDPFQLVVHKK